MISPFFDDFIIIDHDEKFLQDTNHTIFPLSCLMEESANSYPPWIYCDDGTCRCGEIPHSILDIWPEKVSVLDCYCLTYNEEKHTNELGHCLFNCARKDDNTGTTILDPIHHPLPMNVSKLNDFMCEGFKWIEIHSSLSCATYHILFYCLILQNKCQFLSLAWVYLILSNHICASNGTSLSLSSQRETIITTCSKMLIISIWNMESSVFWHFKM